MFPMLYSANDIRKSYDDNGISILSDALSCQVKEQLNSEFELELRYPQNGKDFDLIKNGCLLKARCDNNYNRKLQMFKIYSSNGSDNGITTFKAEHISYALGGYAVSPFTMSKTTATYALQNTYNNSVYLYDGLRAFWTFSSDITDTHPFSVGVPCSVRTAMLDSQSNIADTWFGEFEFDNYDIKLHKQRGKDTGIVLKRDKNIKSLTVEEDLSDTYTHIYPYAQYVDNNGTTRTITVDGGIIECENSNLYKAKRVKIVDFSKYCKDANYFNDITLKAIVDWYIRRYKIDLPKMSLSASFVDLVRLFGEQHVKSLEDIQIGDTITVYYPELQLQNKIELTGMTYDVINERIIDLTLGDDPKNMLNKLFTQRKE